MEVAANHICCLCGSPVDLLCGWLYHSPNLDYMQTRWIENTETHWILLPFLVSAQLWQFEHWKLGNIPLATTRNFRDVRFSLYLLWNILSISLEVAAKYFKHHENILHVSNQYCHVVSHNVKNCISWFLCLQPSKDFFSHQMCLNMWSVVSISYLIIYFVYFSAFISFFKVLYRFQKGKLFIFTHKIGSILIH